MLLRNSAKNLRLTYCSNVHPIESSADLLAAATRFWPRLDEALAQKHGQRSFAQGPWLSARAVSEFADDAFLLESFADALIAAHSHAPTANVFPYGDFHDDRVKEKVYLPDWTHEDRLRYTLEAARCLTQLPAEGSYQSLSTVPGTFRSFPDRDPQLIAEMIGRAVLGLHVLEMETERRVVLAFEPEPGCLFQTIDDWLDFFRERLLGRSLIALENFKPGNREFHEHLIRRHVGICYDCCHQGLAYEDPAVSFDALESIGCEVAKIQLSSALEIRSPAENPEALARLATFDEPRYLHQVSARRPDGSIDRFEDLPDFLAGAPQADWEIARIHFHVPIFAESFGPLGTTRAELDRVLDEVAKRPVTELLEIETYSWGVMPGREGEAATEDRLLDDILHEYDYVIGKLD